MVKQVQIKSGMGYNNIAFMVNKWSKELGTPK
jgi:hypothetical protein